MHNPNNVIAVALREVGYLEKKDASMLDAPTANAGSNNYTKYARDLVEMIGSPYAQGAAWCDMFVDWCFIQAYGKDIALKLLGGWSAYTPTSAGYFKNKKQWFASDPQIGDVIFFKNSTRICHTGIVYSVDGKYVYTVEGNTSSSAGVVPNGGCVRRKSYALNYSKIAGYGRPEYYGKILPKSDEEIAKEVYAGKWGNGAKRKAALKEAGYDPEKIQALVNKMVL